MENKKGWLVNDCLTCIPNTTTLWHYLLRNLNLEAQTNVPFQNLAQYVEHTARQHGNPPFIIRNGTFFRKLNIDTYTISLIQDDYTNHKSLLSSQIDVMNHSDMIVFNSPFIYEKYKKYTSKPYCIISLGVNVDLFCPIRNSNHFNILENSILFVGNDSVYPKGFDRVLGIIKKMKNQNFCIVMKNNYSIQNIPEEHRHRVKVFNRVSESDMVSIMNTCVMGICTSRMETQHLAGLEMCACDKPMVSTCIGFYASYPSSKWGILVNEYDEDTFIQKIRYVLNHLNEFSPRNFIIEQKFTFKDCIQKWQHILPHNDYQSNLDSPI